ncbi:Hypothetical predicted protein [Mytilus galloprovincialis]|uniref:Uncharacterized protein n=1 Tax=Mytilus galloprovincialis TaxID=29158 RepID=A0A8B6H3N6_MYTGA|nr:Hypothetical predicted protein [Mytilus galloprovincialis]
MDSKLKSVRAGHKGAVTMLLLKFDELKVKNRHNLPTPTNDACSLRSYGDKLESYVRGLESLGQTPEMYCKYTGTMQEPNIQTAINVVETTDTTSVLHASQVSPDILLKTATAPVIYNDVNI